MAERSNNMKNVGMKPNIYGVSNSAVKRGNSSYGNTAKVAGASAVSISASGINARRRAIDISIASSQTKSKKLSGYTVFASVMIVIISLLLSLSLGIFTTAASLEKDKITSSLNDYKQINQTKQIELDQKEASLLSLAKSYGMQPADKSYALSIEHKKIYGQ